MKCKDFENLYVKEKIQTNILEAVNIFTDKLSANSIYFDNCNVRLGERSGSINQQTNAIAIGCVAGENNQQLNAIAIGREASVNNQGINGISIGNQAGYQNEGQNCIAIGTQSGQTLQATGAIAMGFQAGRNIQGTNSIAIGRFAGQNLQKSSSIAIGFNTGFTGQNEFSVAIGFQSSQINQSSLGISIGTNCGNNQNQNGICIGQFSGQTNQGTHAISIGSESGRTNQGTQSIAIGRQAGRTNQSQNAIAIGVLAGASNQGSNAIAIGFQIGTTVAQASQSIAINATTSALNTATSSGFYVNPIRTISDPSAKILSYNTTSREIFYNSAAAKTFVINHPIKDDKYLVHACLEGPEAGVYYRGKSEITNNEYVIIKLPDYVRYIAYEFTIQVTQINNGEKIHLSISEVENNEFKVYGKNTKFYYIIQGKRQNIEVEPNINDVQLKGDGPYTYIVQ